MHPQLVPQASQCLGCDLHRNKLHFQMLTFQHCSVASSAIRWRHIHIYDKPVRDRHWLVACVIGIHKTLGPLRSSATGRLVALLVVQNIGPIVSLNLDSSI
jgi:hypothetical protein